MNKIFSPSGEDEKDRGPLMGGLACLPVFFSLARKRVVLAGGSNAVLWKAELCQAAGARLDVFSPDPCSGLVFLARRCPAVALVLRRIQPKDFRGAALAIVDAEGAAEAAEFQAAARAAGVTVNVIDKPGYSDFQFGAIVDRSPLVIGISTDGGSPVLAQAIRGRLEALLPREIELWAQIAKVWRGKLKLRDAPSKTRRRFWELFSRHAGRHPPPRSHPARRRQPRQRRVARCGSRSRLPRLRSTRLRSPTRAVCACSTRPASS